VFLLPGRMTTSASAISSNANLTAGDERNYCPSSRGQIDGLSGPVHFLGEFAAKGLLVQQPWTQQREVIVSLSKPHAVL
jgi:hypothetical protein